MAAVGKFSDMRRVVDQSITAHSILRDRYTRRSTVLDVSLLVLSVAITFISLASSPMQKLVLPNLLQTSLTLPILALLLLVVSIVELRVGWKAKSTSHGQAADVLASFKSELGKMAEDIDHGNVIGLESIVTNYRYVNSSIVNIPEASFLKLKKAHKRKVEISRYLDEHPGAMIPLLKFEIFLRDNFSANLFVEDKRNEESGNDEAGQSS